MCMCVCFQCFRLASRNAAVRGPPGGVAGKDKPTCTPNMFISHENKHVERNRKSISLGGSENVTPSGSILFEKRGVVAYDACRSCRLLRVSQRGAVEWISPRGRCGWRGRNGPRRGGTAVGVAIRRRGSVTLQLLRLIRRRQKRRVITAPRTLLLLHVFFSTGTS